MAGGDDRTWGSATDDPWRDDLGDDDGRDREEVGDIDVVRLDVPPGRTAGGARSDQSLAGGREPFLAGGQVVLESPDDEPDDLDDFDEEDFDDDFDDDFEEESEDEYEMDNEEYPDDDFGEGTEEEELDGVDLDEEIEGEEAATGEEELIEGGGDAEESGEAEAGFEE